jgi:hypothetical protein
VRKSSSTDHLDIPVQVVTLQNFLKHEPQPARYDEQANTIVIQSKT